MASIGPYSQAQRIGDLLCSSGVLGLVSGPQGHGKRLAMRPHTMALPSKAWDAVRESMVSRQWTFGKTRSLQKPILNSWCNGIGVLNGFLHAFWLVTLALFCARQSFGCLCGRWRTCCRSWAAKISCQCTDSSLLCGWYQLRRRATFSSLKMRYHKIYGVYSIYKDSTVELQSFQSHTGHG